MAIDVLARNDVLGDKIAHLYKSGNVLRHEDCDSFSLRDLLPDRAPHNTNLEYDLWYDMGGDKEIHGYSYTDMLSSFIYIRTANFYFSQKTMIDALSAEITAEGRGLVERIAKKTGDKYRLRTAFERHDFVVFLPGTNCINDAFDWDLGKQAVAQGAVFKPHPLSSVSLIRHLKNEYGDANILDKRMSGHELLTGADIVGCCANSEMGIAAIARGCGFHMFSPESIGYSGKSLTYSSIYRALLKGGNHKENLQRIVSCESSGLVSNASQNAQQRINNFFQQFEDVPHVEPTNPRY
ncbi:MAG: hypothetical protein L7S55_09020 [Luminiphilus sp.]|nr:hypothetical protein [Luminiphilus sp.]